MTVGRMSDKLYTMNAILFISITGNGLARAICSPRGTWQVDFSLQGQDLCCLASDPRYPQILYAGTQGGGVLRSVDGGRTWQTSGLPGRIVKSLTVSSFPGSNPAGMGIVYAGTKSPASIFISSDGGESWTELEAFRRIRSRWLWFSPAEPPFTAYVQGIAASPTDPDVLVAGVEYGAVVRSRDSGRTWSDHRPGAGRDCHSLTFHAANGDWVYEGGGTGPAYSRDGGQTWRQPKEGLDRRYCWAVAADAVHPEVWYVSASPGPTKAHSRDNAQAYIFRSIGGAPWEKLSGGLPEPLKYMPYALVTDPSAQGHLYTGLSNGEVWFSEDYGNHWGKLPINLGGIHTALLMFTGISDP